LNTEDFTDDKKDAGELGAGQTVTTIYEIIPAGVEDKFTKGLPKLKYQKSELTSDASNNEIATVKFRYKKPDENKSIEFIYPVADNAVLLINSSEIYRFSSAVALFGMLLEKSEFSGSGNYKMVIALAQNAKADDTDGYKAEFVRLAQVVK
jgi:Ca-activated chloride channel family protein